MNSKMKTILMLLCVVSLIAGIGVPAMACDRYDHDQNNHDYYYDDHYNHDYYDHHDHPDRDRDRMGR